MGSGAAPSVISERQRAQRSRERQRADRRWGPGAQPPSVMSIGDTGTALVAKREITEALRAKATRITLAITAVAVIAIVVIAHFASGSGPPTHAGRHRRRRRQRRGGPLRADRRRRRHSRRDRRLHRRRRRVGGGGRRRRRLPRCSPTTHAIVTTDPVDLSGQLRRSRPSSTCARRPRARARVCATPGCHPTRSPPSAATPPPPVESLNATAERQGDSAASALAIVMNILLFLLLQTYGGWVVERRDAGEVVACRRGAALVGAHLANCCSARSSASASSRSCTPPCWRRAALRDRRASSASTWSTASAPVDVGVGGVWFILGYRCTAARSPPPARCAAGRGRPGRGDADHAAAARRLHHRVLGGRRRDHPAVGARASSRRPPCCACRCSTPPARCRSGRSC